MPADGHESAHDHDRSHGTGMADQPAALAGNIEIHAGDTAQSAYSEMHNDLPVWSLTQMVNDIDKLSNWTVDTVTFAFPVDESSDYIGNSREGTLAGFTAAQAAAGREVMDLFQDLINVEFVDLGANADPADDVDAEIRFYNSTLSGTAGGAPAGSGTAGDIWVYNYEPAKAEGYNLTPGGYHYHILLHEMGHVMGLSHTSFKSGDSYAERANYLQNNAAYSMMSYLTAGSGGLDWDTGYSSTPMLVDVAALQSVYGANMGTRTGDTVYGFNATADRNAFDFDALLAEHGKIGAVTIWDAGGTDTLDMSKFAQNGYISLVDGTHSSVGGHDLNLAIAKGAVIENAIAGSGDDRLLGNAAANVLTGGMGADTLLGAAGDDFLTGDMSTADARDFTVTAAVLHGAQGLDFTFDGAGSTALTIEMLIAFDADVAGGQWFADMPGDWTIVYDRGNGGLWYRANGTWAKVDIRPSDVDDEGLHRLSIAYDGAGGKVAFYLDGILRSEFKGEIVPQLVLDTAESFGVDHDGMIADVRIFDGLRSADDIYENHLNSIAADTEGLLSYVVFDDDKARDLVGDGDVTLHADATFLTSETITRDDTLIGGAGRDTLVGGEGADHINGGPGTDLADYRSSAAAIEIDLAKGVGLGGDAEGDMLKNIEWVIGSGGADVLGGSAKKDTLSGASGDDTLSGQGGNDRLFGGNGHDHLEGGAGDDRLTGGGGRDHFVFFNEGGTDMVTDFDLKKDTLTFADADDFDALAISSHNLGAFVQAGSVAAIIMGVDAADLTDTHFDYTVFDVA
ncbi:M10 family metallopeptidase C-terminal domain-containing protein [uncultured Sulfitobacter sp.]|uniref:M10 family metallopeptidase C-terminal domain-containing protein n=1 Tax=uncultured Sulfitobacter sp. TaxID=191468 RepID=UPI0026182C98|nr:M10 family metallopeptidase C-terminal domain-containing protein [uncultured Sulfitobacter sp.]